VALPSEYKIHEGSIVFLTYRTLFTEEDLRTGIAHAEYQVAVEVDQTDPEAREGWLVLVRGAAHHLDTEAERASIASLGLKPWVEGEPEHFIRVNPTGIGGQRLRRLDASDGMTSSVCSVLPIGANALAGQEHSSMAGATANRLAT
jgi:hypothetical protein